MAQKQTTKTEETALTPPPNGTTALAAFDYGDDAGGGYEHQDKDDTAIPFLNCLQANSPLVSEAKNKNARPGMIWNSVTDQLYDGDHGVVFVPATTRHNYTEFVPRTAGGGFKGSHETDSELVAKLRQNGAFGKLTTPDGNELIETFYVYGVVCDAAGNPESMAVVAFSSTKIKAYKKWMTMLRSFQITMPNGRRATPPLFAHVSVLGTEVQKNEKGVFHVFTARPFKSSVAESLLAPDHPAYVMARQCRDLVDKGTAKADYSRQQDAAGSADPEAAPF